MNSMINTKNNLKRSLFYIITLMSLVIMFSVAGTVSKAAELNTSSEETTFDAAYYASQYPDVVTIFGNDPDILYYHYVNFGKAEGRYANAQEALAAVTATQTSTDTTTATDTTTVTDLLNPVVGTVNNGEYNILAIGNSITLHPVCSYWWGTWGMAATSSDKDYIHQVKAGLEQTYSTVNLDIISVQSWETSSNRSKQLRKFDEKLANSYDLVIIQLGENVSDMTTFKKDFNNLVSHVKETQPNAKVVVVGDYWYRSGRDYSKSSVAAKQGCAYVDLSPIRGDKNYRASRGTMVLGDDGQLHTMTNSWVLKHPNDLGMQYIATKILDCLK